MIRIDLPIGNDIQQQGEYSFLALFLKYISRKENNDEDDCRGCAVG
jgi:hypothetical protein